MKFKFIHKISVIHAGVASHALLAQLYADDVQAYQHCRTSDQALSQK